jgi:hypothetical protein
VFVGKINGQSDVKVTVLERRLTFAKDRPININLKGERTLLSFFWRTKS